MRKLVLLGLSVMALAACGGEDGDSTASATPDVDRAFIDAMVPHHQDAIAMAGAAEERGFESDELTELAGNIRETQQEEIDRMLGWREEWFGSRELEPDGEQRLGLDQQHAAEPGAGERAIEAADDVDTVFAQQMTPHHESAVAMAEIALEQSENDDIRELASAIKETQSDELEILARHGGGEGGHG